MPAMVDAAGLLCAHRLALGVYRLTWSSPPPAAWPSGDALLVDSTQATAAWIEVADIIVYPMPTAMQRAKSMASSLLAENNAALVAVRLNRGVWLVGHRYGRFVIMVVPDDSSTTMFQWTSLLYRSTVDGSLFNGE